jgi:hypothetical protein
MVNQRARYALIVLGWCLCAVALAGGGTVAAAPNRQDDLTVLVYGQTVSGRLDNAQPSAFYAFDAQAADVVTITMIVSEGEIDPFLVLNDVGRTPLATDDNSGGGVNARLTFVIPITGRYIIQATHAGGIMPEGGGEFSLNLTAAVDTATPTAEPVEGPVPTPDTGGQPDIPGAQGDSIRLARLTPGAPVRDTLDRQTALRFYWFAAEQGDQVMIAPEQLADFQPLIVLYDGDFVEQQRSTGSAGLQAILPSGGIFFVAVSLPDTSSAGGGYGFAFNLAGNPATTGSFIDIAYGQTERGNIDASVPAVTYRFRGTAGDVVTITMGRAGGDLNSYLYLLDENGQLLFEDNDSGGSSGDARIEFTLPADGVYLIVAARLGQAQGTTSGSYILDLRSDAAPPPENVEPTLPPDYEAFPLLAYGDSVEGELSNAKFMDIYVFLGREGDRITVEMTGLNKDTPGALDPLLVLLDDGRIPLVENDDIVDGVERDSRLEFTLPRAGYYAIVATRFDQEAGVTAGPYSLALTGPGGATQTAAPSISDTPPLARLNSTPLQPGTPAQATFDTVADLYSFSADSGALVDLSVTTDPGLDAVVILADENLNEVLSSGTGALTGITIPKTGQYVALLAPRFGPASASGGGYILALTETGGAEADSEVDEGPRHLVYGDTINGVIGEDGASQVYTFVGAEGQHVRISMEATPGSSLDCYLELRDENDAVIEANDDVDPGVVRDSRIVVDLPADGEYTVIASRFVGPDEAPTTGSYRVSLELLDETSAGVSSQTVPIAYGQTEIGEITDDQYLVFYVFDGTAGDVVTIEVDTLSGTLDAVLHFFRSEGAQWIEIASNDDSPTGGTYDPMLGNIILPQTGKYLIAVSRYGLDREHTFGTFSVTVTLGS